MMPPAFSGLGLLTVLKGHSMIPQTVAVRRVPPVAVATRTAVAAEIAEARLTGRTQRGARLLCFGDGRRVNPLREAVSTTVPGPAATRSFSKIR